MNGSQTVAAQHVGLGLRSRGGDVNVPPLDRGAVTAPALIPRQKAATFSNVQVGIYMSQMLYAGQSSREIVPFLSDF